MYVQRRAEVGVLRYIPFPRLCLVVVSVWLCTHGPFVGGVCVCGPLDLDLGCNDQA